MNKIDKNIIGYDLVKDCINADGAERTFCDYLFAVKRGEYDNSSGYLNAICEVRPYTDQNYKEMHKKFNFEHYIIWSGTIWDSRRMGGKIIEFYWS